MMPRLIDEEKYNKLGTSPLISSTDMGNGNEAVEVELDLPSGETIRIDIYSYAEGEEATKFNVLRDLRFVLQDYDHEKDDGYYPTDTEFALGGSANADIPLVSGEYMAISKEDSEFLSNLSKEL